MTARARVKVDIDNVLNNLCRQMVDIYNEQNDSNISYEDITMYDFTCFQDESIISSLRSMFYVDDILESLTPPKLAQEGLRKICDKYDVWITTASNYRVFPQKVEWCKKFYPWLDENRIICIKDKYLLDTDYSIDDWQNNLVRDNSHRILVDAPWNRSVRDDVWSMHRVTNLVEAFEKINEIESRINY